MTVAVANPDNRISFITHCPNCNVEIWPFFDGPELLQRLESSEARFYCVSCDNHWKPIQQEREKLIEYVKGRLASGVFPLSSAKAT